MTIHTFVTSCAAVITTQEEVAPSAPTAQPTHHPRMRTAEILLSPWTEAGDNEPPPGYSS